jgi:hypothetical protein
MLRRRWQSDFHKETVRATDSKNNRNFLTPPLRVRSVEPPSAPTGGYAAPRALACRPARRGGLAGARLWLVLDMRRRG